MDHPLLVDVSQPLGRLPDQVAGLRHRQRTGLGDEAVEAQPLDELHHQEVQVAGFLSIVSGDDVGMRELRGGLEFAEKPLDRRGTRQKRWRDYLQSYQPLHQAVLGLINGPHAAGRDQSQDVIPGMVAQFGRDRAGIGLGLRRLDDGRFG